MWISFSFSRLISFLLFFISVESVVDKQQQPFIPSTSQNAKNSTVNGTVAVPDLKLDDVVWCHLKGWPKWPAKITKIYGKTNQMLHLVWFKEYRISMVHKGQVSKFTYEPYDVKNTQLESAIKEAILYIKSKEKWCQTAV